MLTLANPEVKQKSMATHSWSASTMLGIWWKKKHNNDIRTIEGVDSGYPRPDRRQLIFGQLSELDRI